jgi:hypothetical protein
VKNIQAGHQQLEMTVAERNGQLKHLVETMTRSVRELENEVTAAKDATQAAATGARLETKNALASDVDSLASQVQHHAQQVAELSAAEQRLHDEIVAEEASASTLIPDLKNQYRLFMNIANIEWDYADEAAVKGSAHMLNSREIRPFSLSSAETSSAVATADALWDVLWTDHAPATA